MNEIPCIPGATNIELWKSVSAQLSDFPSLLDVFNGDTSCDMHSGEATSCSVESEDISMSQNESLSGRSKKKSSSSEQLKAYQRRLLTCLNESPGDLNHLLPPHIDLQVLTSSQSLVVPEETFQAACQQAVVALEEDHVGWVAQFILLPMVSQLSRPLPHPCQQQLTALVEQHPSVLTNCCLCPALRCGTSCHSDQLVAALLDRLPTVMMTRVAALLRSLTSREHLEESALVVVESAGVALPPTSTPSSHIAAEAVVAALATLCAGLPADSSRVGRVLLRLTHKLTPYLADNPALRRQFADTVEGHASPLQRPIKMQLAKIA